MDGASTKARGSYVTTQPPGRPGAVGATSDADAAPVTGGLAWWSAFYTFIPVLGLLVWVLVAISTYREERANPVEAVRVNVRNGLNWTLTFVGGQVLLLALLVTFIVAGVESRDGAWAALAASAVLLVAAGWSTLALVTAIMGGTAAAQGIGFRTVFAIPFVRSA